MQESDGSLEKTCPSSLYKMIDLTTCPYTNWFKKQEWLEKKEFGAFGEIEFQRHIKWLAKYIKTLKDCGFSQNNIQKAVYPYFWYK